MTDRLFVPLFRCASLKEVGLYGRLPHRILLQQMKPGEGVFL